MHTTPISAIPISSAQDALDHRAVSSRALAITSRYIHTVDTSLIMAADSIAGYIQGLMDGVAFTHNAYALDRDSRKATSWRRRVNIEPGVGQVAPLYMPFS